MAILKRLYIDALLDGNRHISSVRDTIDAKFEAQRIDLDRQYSMAIQFERALTADGNEAEKAAIRKFLTELQGGAEE